MMSFFRALHARSNEILVEPLRITAVPKVCLIGLWSWDLLQNKRSGSQIVLGNIAGSICLQVMDGVSWYGNGSGNCPQVKKPVYLIELSIPQHLIVLSPLPLMSRELAFHGVPSKKSWVMLLLGRPQIYQMGQCKKLAIHLGQSHL